jgi:hypothetical protein
MQSFGSPVTVAVASAAARRARSASRSSRSRGEGLTKSALRPGCSLRPRAASIFTKIERHADQASDGDAFPAYD